MHYCTNVDGIKDEKIQAATRASSALSNRTVPHPFDRPRSSVMRSARITCPEYKDEKEGCILRYPNSR